MKAAKYKKIVINFVDSFELEPHDRLLRNPKRFEDCVRIFGEQLEQVWEKKIKEDADRSREATKCKRRTRCREYQRKKRVKLSAMEADARSRSQLYRVTTGTPSLHGLNKSVQTEKVIVENTVDGVAACMCIKDGKRFKVKVNQIHHH